MSAANWDFRPNSSTAFISRDGIEYKRWLKSSSFSYDQKEGRGGLPLSSLSSPPPVHLPTDIIHIIVDNLSNDFEVENSDSWVRHQNRLRRVRQPPSLFALRLVCREFCRIVSWRTFRVLWITHTVRSMEGFLATIRSPWITHCVQENLTDTNLQLLVIFRHVVAPPLRMMVMITARWFVICCTVLCVACTSSQRSDPSPSVSAISLRKRGNSIPSVTISLPSSTR
ncbi:hypothetical protein B0F90DRAFT_667974 [Multifurca ochricompacta]|uniref:F-box domain-containing protein n=1 Tax=Multifurca ochricompacta TaxID=376703 RepID=A0AAD4LUK2_9AGAM|nr:hypothetical protein B0F90DRAFT_667974 [Multifurca ochricompacta]